MKELINAVKAIEKESISIVAKSLPGNKLGIEKENLKTKPNPNGDGIFVYVQGTNFYGVKRNISWIVVDGRAFPVNGATMGCVTPNLKFPREVKGICERTGVGSHNVADVIKTIFEGE